MRFRCLLSPLPLRAEALETNLSPRAPQDSARDWARPSARGFPRRSTTICGHHGDGAAAGGCGPQRDSPEDRAALGAVGYVRAASGRMCASLPGPMPSGNSESQGDYLPFECAQATLFGSRPACVVALPLFAFALLQRKGRRAQRDTKCAV